MDTQNLALVALTPGDMQPAQEALAHWCDQKCEALNVELADLEEHALIASNNGWKLRGLQAAITRTQKRLVYYAKVKAAVAEGYLLVPNFPVRVLAVRVQRMKQRQTAAQYETSSAFDTKPELLPAGEGRYVDERLFTSDQSHTEPDGKGGTKIVRRYVSEDYDAPDFPFAAVKPAVLAATERAMAKQIFDTIGVVENSAGRDPIMVGQLLDPRGNDRRTTFFIAWWLNTEDL
jgi:hypothetical protein